MASLGDGYARPPPPVLFGSLNTINGQAGFKTQQQSTLYDDSLPWIPGHRVNADDDLAALHTFGGPQKESFSLKQSYGDDAKMPCLSSCFYKGQFGDAVASESRLTTEEIWSEFRNILDDSVPPLYLATSEPFAGSPPFDNTEAKFLPFVKEEQLDMVGSRAYYAVPSTVTPSPQGEATGTAFAHHPLRASNTENMFSFLAKSSNSDISGIDKFADGFAGGDYIYQNNCSTSQKFSSLLNGNCEQLILHNTAHQSSAAFMKGFHSDVAKPTYIRGPGLALELDYGTVMEVWAATDQTKDVCRTTPTDSYTNTACFSGLDAPCQTVASGGRGVPFSPTTTSVKTLHPEGHFDRSDFSAGDEKISRDEFPHTSKKQTRQELLRRYREKKLRRTYIPKVRYTLLKANADNRPRVKGRFVKKSDFQQTKSESHLQTQSATTTI